MYSSLCQPVQSMLQKETDKCRNWRVLSNILFWTLLISFPSLISCFYFFSYFYLWTHCFKYFTFKKCLIINKYNWKESGKVHGVCWKETDKVHGAIKVSAQSQNITGTIWNSEQRNVIAFGKAYFEQFETNKCALIPFLGKDKVNLFLF